MARKKIENHPMTINAEKALKYVCQSEGYTDSSLAKTMHCSTVNVNNIVNRNNVTMKTFIRYMRAMGYEVKCVNESSGVEFRLRIPEDCII